MVNVVGVMLGIGFFIAALLVAYAVYKMLDNKDKKKQEKLGGMIPPVQHIQQPPTQYYQQPPQYPAQQQAGAYQNNNISPNQLELFNIQQQLREMKQYEAELRAKEKALQQLVNVGYRGMK